MAPAKKGKAKSKAPEPELTPGQLRLLADKRQITGILLIAGFCAIIQPLAGIANAIGPDGTTVTFGENKVGFFALLGGLCLVACGVVSVTTAYLAHVMNFESMALTIVAIVFVQFG